MTRKAHRSLNVSPEPEDTSPAELSQVNEPAQVKLSPLDVATFIEGMAAELRVMARGAHFDMLAYLLDMTRVEAAAQIEQITRDRSR